MAFRDKYGNPEQSRMRVGRVFGCLAFLGLLLAAGYSLVRLFEPEPQPGPEAPTAAKPAAPESAVQIGWYPMLSGRELSDIMAAAPEQLELDRAGRRLFINLPGDKRLETHIDPCIQKLAFDIFHENRVLWGALAAMDARTGAVKALVTYHRGRRDQLWYNILDPFPLAGHYPAASITKITTAAVALSRELWDEDEAIACRNTLAFESGQFITDPHNVFHGDVTMGQAMAASCNYSFGRIAVAVGRDSLVQGFKDFGYGRAVPFELPVQADEFSVGNGDYELARAGTGFGDVTLSPLHGAVIAAALANDGMAPRPHLGAMLTSGPRTLSIFYPGDWFAITDKSTAARLQAMLELTVHWNDPARSTRRGTAWQAFHHGGAPLLPGRRFAGKTGSLSGTNPPGRYFWFIGFPVEQNPVAYSVMVVNEGRGNIRAASTFGELMVRLASGQCPIDP